jgi:DNA-binding LytR/AlgR family response regulator
MPHISGLSLARMLDKKIKIIFTTAYSDYAVESYEVAAIDYLLKPITLERFMVAMGKVMEGHEHPENKIPQYIWIKSGGKDYKLSIDSIWYLQKDGNYMTYFSRDIKVIARESIADALDKLPSFFCRTHKSFIINLKQVTAVDLDCLFINETVIPVGSSFKEQLMLELDKYSA